MASAVPNKPGQLYVHCYDNDDDRTSLAVFTPYGKVFREIQKLSIMKYAMIQFFEFVSP